METRSTRYNSGQIGIIMLLITVVMLTVGISAVSRTTSDVNISSTNEQANRALDAAESDVEKALSGDLSTVQNGTTTNSTQGTNGSIHVATTVNQQRILETNVDQGYTVGVDLTGNGTSPITITWAKNSACASNPASLVLTILNFTNAAVPQVRRYYVGNATCHTDNFDAATVLGAGNLRLQYVVPAGRLAAGDELMRIRPLYNDTDIQVQGGSLPTQSYSVKSVAQNTTSMETKAVQVNRTIPIAPTVLDYVLFSGTSITQ